MDFVQSFQGHLFSTYNMAGSSNPICEMSYRMALGDFFFFGKISFYTMAFGIARDL